MPIRAVLFAEFDVEKGPIISHCYPENYVDEKLQQQLKHLTIPKPILYNHKMCFTFDNLLFIGHPMCIKGHKYKRNELLFNLVLVVEQVDDEPSTPYITALEKLAGSLRQLEDMAEWVWKQSKQWDPQNLCPTASPSSPSPSLSASDSYDDRKGTRDFSSKDPFKLADADVPEDEGMPLCDILERIFNDLNRRGCVVLPITPANIMTVRLQENYQPTPYIKCHEVPVVIYEPECYHQYQYWDMACEVVKSCVDGEKYVPLIAETLGMTVKHVQAVLGTLQQYHIIGMVDIFQFSNRYVVTETLADFSPHLTDPAKKRKVQQALSCGLLPLSGTGARTTLEQVLRFFSLMTPEAEEPIGKLATHLPEKLDLKSTVQFGVLHQILRRVHEWVIVPSEDDIPRVVTDSNLGTTEKELLITCLQTRQCLDAICVALRTSRDRMLDLLQPHVDAQRCFIILKPA